MSTTIALVALGLWIVLQTTRGPLAAKLGIDSTASPSSGSGSSSSSSGGGGVNWYNLLPGGAGLSLG